MINTTNQMREKALMSRVHYCPPTFFTTSSCTRWQETVPESCHRAFVHCTTCLSPSNIRRQASGARSPSAWQGGRSPSFVQTFLYAPLQLTLTSWATQFYWQTSQSAVVRCALSKAPSAFRLASFLPRSQTFGDHFPLCYSLSVYLPKDAV